MAQFSKIKHLFAIGAVVCATSALAVSCSKSTDGDDNTDTKGDASLPGTSAVSLPDGVAGKPCTDATKDCAAGATCATSLGVLATFGQGTPAPGGYCTAACLDDSECGDGACVGALAPLNVKGQCLQGCSSDTDCGRAGYVCAELDLQAIAGAASSAAADAGVAVPDAGVDIPEIPKVCFPKPKTVTLAAGIVGKACTEGGSECGDGTCSTSVLGQTLPGGSCTGACLKDAECGTGGVCLLPIVTPFFSTPGNCVKGCSADTDCRASEGYVCSPAGNGAAAAPRYCTLPAPVQDAGVPGTDAGSTSPVSDAGTTVATDAGVADAG
ncbi:MAG: hypothetical protein RL385_1304 [Pseudomonadota bacterium]|jgi:hypothetical protein